jgi:MoaA/NifB/PqqE/SkfB family radical SAM enzyme
MGFSEKNCDLAGILQHKVFEGPRHVVIDLTNRCNTNCIACWTYSPHLKPEQKPPKSWYRQELSLDLIQKLVEDLHRLGVERIRFTGGGEPLIHRQFPEIVNIVKEKGIWLAITTNGLLLHRHLDLMRDAWVDEIALSLWAASDKTYHELHPRSRPGDFYKILDAVQKMRSARPTPELHLLNVISKVNVGEISRMADLARNLRADGVYFTLVDALDDTRFLVLNQEQREQATLEIQRVKSRFYQGNENIHWDNLDGFENRLKDVQEDTLYDKSIIDSLPCYMGWHFTRVTADGIVAPCCRGVDYPMGNLHEHSFEEIWRGKPFQEFRQMSLLEKKDHSYFKKMNCYQMCDNLMHNQQIQERLECLSELQKKELTDYEAPILQEI